VSQAKAEMQDHFALLVLFSLLVSAAFATLQRDRPREQMKLGSILFVSFIGAAFVLGWLMYFLPIGAS
jgi:hypothetical protein